MSKILQNRCFGRKKLQIGFFADFFSTEYISEKYHTDSFCIWMFLQDPENFTWSIIGRSFMQCCTEKCLITPSHSSSMVLWYTPSLNRVLLQNFNFLISLLWSKTRNVSSGWVGRHGRLWRLISFKLTQRIAAFSFDLASFVALFWELYFGSATILKVPVVSQPIQSSNYETHMVPGVGIVLGYLSALRTWNA